ncbi:hypothetical protein FIT71_04215 [Candidatus Methylopumilus universalis]|uniref:hypothetical protein n=1 Tax=Candidatus Methylopumilus universalis TaxID=2588536 RepID=UPI0011206F91|nr:hypothetical protein [Candidatus Methylopumilus universalis]QDC46230.1 hypothetical protein FIT71_04215 [Candidatus Methylopumilus universalis]
MQNKKYHTHKKTWAIAFVNYYTSDLMDFQFRQLAAIKNRHEFNIYIVDNSRNSEIKKLKNLVSKYKLLSKTHFFYNGDTEKVSSAAHAEALKIIYKNTNNESYFLVQDPDYFWLVKDHLLMLHMAIDAKNLIAIGSPYKKPVANGNADFPCAFGAVYRLNKIDSNDFDISKRLSLIFEYANDASSFNCAINTIKENKSSDDYNPFDTFEYDYSFDVGWKIRKNLHGSSYESFKQFPALGLRNIFGSHSYISLPQLYFYENEVVSIHLFRGSFTGLPENLNRNISTDAPRAWNKARVKYAKLAFFLARFAPLKRVAIKVTYFFHYVKDHDDFNWSYLFSQNMHIPECRLKTQLYHYKKDFLKEELDVFDKYSSDIKKNQKESIIIFNKFLNPNTNKNAFKDIKKICIKIFGQTNNQYLNALFKTLININIKSNHDFNFFLQKPSIKLDEKFDFHFFELKMKIQILLIIENLLHSNDI